MYSKLFRHFFVLLLLLAGITFYYNYQTSMLDSSGGHSHEVRAKVITVDDSELVRSGYSTLGYQELQVQLLEGAFAGQTVRALNNLMGQSDLEDIFQVDDEILAAVITADDEIEQVIAINLYRQSSLLNLFIVFVVALILYAGVVGIKALMSFVLTVFIIWEVLIQQILAGYSPLITTTYTLVLLAAVIIFLVAGVNKKGVTAFIGTICGLCVTLGITYFYSDQVGLFGLTQPYVNSLIFSGYFHLDIRQIFYSAIILGASGACMDLAMDIAASMDEVKINKPEITPLQLIYSGFTVGRHVIGTMATTLLLAYSGGYLTLLLIFQVKEPSIVRMLNMKIVAAEIMRTLVGSIGLVLVAPITALVGGVIISGVYSSFFVKKSKD